MRLRQRETQERCGEHHAEDAFVDDLTVGGLVNAMINTQALTHQ
jgi:hypothetical protein